MRLFNQPKSGIENDRTGGPQPVDEDKFDLHQTFLDVKFGVNTNQWLTFRAGRQEIAFGSSRLVSVREGPNVRQSFDGLRTIVHTGSLQVDGFVTRPVKTNLNIFDDGPDNSQTFWGIYSVFPFPFLLKGNIDLYYLGLNHNDATFDQGTAHELRHSSGTRLWNKMELRWDGVPSLADALRMLREQARRTQPPQWVRVVGGWSEFQFKEQRMPTLDEINAVAPDTPVFILHLYAHALLNRAALRAVGYTKDTPNPPGGEIRRDKHGNPNG